MKVRLVMQSLLLANPPAAAQSEPDDGMTLVVRTAVDWWVLAPTAIVTFGATAFAGVMAGRVVRGWP